MKLSPQILPAIALLTFAAGASAQILLTQQRFDALTSIDPWNPAANATVSDKAWLAAGGNPGGAIEFSGTNPAEAGAAFIFTYSEAIDFGGASEVTLTMDVRITDPLVGAAIHLETNTMGPAGASNPNNFFNLEAGLDTSYTTLNFEISGVPSNADTLFLGFNLAGGAFVGSGGGFAVDNIELTAPGLAVIPEPSILAALVGLMGMSVILRRRRS